MTKTWLYLTAEGLVSPSADWPCCLWSPDGERRRLPLHEAAVELNGQAVDVLLPMEMCSGFRSDPWPSRRQPGPQALAFAIEEQLAENLEALHICIGARDREQRYPVIVVQRTRFQALLALLNEHTVDVRTMHVDADLLPADKAYGVRWFDRWLLGGALPARVALSVRSLATLKSGLPENMSWKDEGQDRTGIDEWLLGAAGQPVNLLQGEFRRRRRRLPWRGAAAAVLGMLVLSSMFSEARVRFLEREARSLYTQSEQRFKSLYPEQSRIVDLAAQFQVLQSHRGKSQNTQITRLVGLTDQVIGASNVEVQRIDFREDEGWKIQLTATSFVELEQLRERGQQSAMSLTLGSASKQGNRVQATLTLENG
ncbi:MULTISPECIES: type II secretion system protein GspL [unclassified Pseudomonas]|uniref:type II secretion system protein GspL n=1 Tax=unclassified Pseudomonas TaxID=196821 RepID=UPI001199900A|nr:MULTISPECIES: type II secretion system protein GspL [unclassified Pseudomonas]TWC10531.1 type II secretion system protein L (GspL) [Pseudomonas sp. SJZ075]TWC26686.1 type II secretion system protein L (GspL) [Pseudomonas sp. SJZ078]TWC45857.1 type II secretion system protein L (GspL) [Pseudomonas sp. SJZ124]TWC46122.1 type II secretion system protein L (GspL) [Pseudomonas sp. SJZ080]TWC81128.1 type II secretion system protein L (GspL) [Pseudomonas sp. SJZ101]